MSAGHFFVGLGAGIAILSIPVMIFTPGSGVPQHVIDWIEGPPPQATDVDQATGVNRPLDGYQPGKPTPTPGLQAVPPTLQPLVLPTAVPTRQPQPLVNAPALNTLRWSGTGVIRSGGIPVYVRKIAGVDSRDDPMLPDGSPVLVSSTPPVQVGAQQWRAVRGLSGIIGWVPVEQVAVDGETPPPPLFVGPTATVAASPSAAARGVIANTGGTGVVLRNSPNDADRTHSGLMDGAGVTILAYAGTDWVQVRSDTGQTGWVPAQYIIASLSG